MMYAENNEFNIKRFFEERDFAVHVSTEEEAQEFVAAFWRHWGHNDDKCPYCKFDLYRENTCYQAMTSQSVTLRTVRECMADNTTIVEMCDFMPENEIDASAFDVKELFGL